MQKQPLNWQDLAAQALSKPLFPKLLAVLVFHLADNVSTQALSWKPEDLRPIFNRNLAFSKERFMILGHVSELADSQKPSFLEIPSPRSGSALWTIFLQSFNPSDGELSLDPVPIHFLRLTELLHLRGLSAETEDVLYWRDLMLLSLPVHGILPSHQDTKVQVSFGDLDHIRDKTTWLRMMIGMPNIDVRYLLPIALNERPETAKMIGWWSGTAGAAQLAFTAMKLIENSPTSHHRLVYLSVVLLVCSYLHKTSTDPRQTYWAAHLPYNLSRRAYILYIEGTLCYAELSGLKPFLSDLLPQLEKSKVTDTKRVNQWKLYWDQNPLDLATSQQADIEYQEAHNGWSLGNIKEPFFNFFCGCFGCQRLSSGSVPSS